MNFFDFFGKKNADNQTTNPQSESFIQEGAIKVHNLIILDESGSMDAIYREALIGVNNTLKTIRSAQKSHPDQYHTVSLITFDSEHYNKIYYNAPAGMTDSIRPEQYRPCGGTPLLDTMGRAINELRRTVNKGDIVLVTIITDGYENASREYNARMINNLVSEMKAQDWIFTYIGANQDVHAVGSDLAIDNCLGFEADSEGTEQMWKHENKCRNRLFDRLSDPECSRSKLMDDYFDE